MPTASMPSAPVFTARVPFQFLSADAPSLNVTLSSPLYNNPASVNIVTGDVSKVDLGINGLLYYRGDGEFPPFYIELIWNQMGYNDYLSLAALRPYLITMITFRNIGYYGKLVLGGPVSAKANSADVVKVTAKFYPLAPSDAGGAAAVARIAAPTALSVTSGAANSGYITANTGNYYWLTFSSIYGETLPYASGLISSATANIKNTITWTWPAATAYCIKSSLYVAAVNDSTQARLLQEIPNGLTASWTDYVGYVGSTVTQAPPAASTAYRGRWQGGVFINESP